MLYACLFYLKGGNKLSYRLYICKRKKLCSQDIDAKLKELIDLFKENPDELTQYDVVKHLGFQEVMPLGSDDDAETIRKQGKSYLSKEQSHLVNIPYEGERDIDGKRIVKLTKDMILLYLDAIYESMYKYFQSMLDDLESEVGLSVAKSYFHQKAKFWERDSKLGLLSIDFLKPFVERKNKDKLDMPYEVTISTEYTILQLVNLYNDTDWENEDVILYGF